MAATRGWIRNHVAPLGTDRAAAPIGRGAAALPMRGA
jgi:hypothetical protein